jgi:hypothetical protein
MIGKKDEALKTLFFFPDAQFILYHKLSTASKPFSEYPKKPGRRPQESTFSPGKRPA